MFNFIKNYLTTSSETNANFENKITKSLKILTIMIVVLAFVRLLSLEILSMLGELMTAVMIYFYSLSRNKCTAIFCMINGVIGMIYSIAKITHTFPAMKSHWFNFYYSLLFLISLYSILVYGLICYFSYLGLIENNQNERGLFSTSTNYGAITSDDKNIKSFVPFEGRGTIVG